MEDTLDQIRYLDHQLQMNELNDAQQELVSNHRLAANLRRTEAVNEQGLRPADPQGAAAWDQRRVQIEEALSLHDQTERLQTEGLETAWEIYQERERLKESRNSLLTAAAQPVAAQTLAGAAPDDAALQLQQDPQQLQQPAMADGAAPEADAQQQWQVPAWDPTDGTAAEHDPDHVEVMALDMHVAAGFGQAYATAEAPATHPQVPDSIPPAHKLCRRCHSVKPITEFYKSKANADGYDGRCKTCDAKQCVERRKKKQRIDAPTVTHKECHKCKVLKPAGDYYRNRTNNDGLYNNCKACFSQNSQRRQQTLPPMEQRMADAKKCRRCGLIKAASEFYKNRLMLDGLYSHCKSCYQASAAARSAARSPVDAKACRRCGISKPSSEFYKSKMTADGLQSYCKYCYKITAAQSRVKKLEEEQASAAAATQNAALFQVAPGQLLPAEEGQAAAQQQADLAMPASDAAAAVAEAPAEGVQHADTLQQGAEAPGGELAEPHAQLHSLLEASDGGQPQPTPLQPASAPPEQPLLT